MSLLLSRPPGPRFSESACYVFASIFLWATVGIAVAGISDFVFHLSGQNIGGAALIFGGVLIGIVIASAIGGVLGALFALMAITLFKDRKRLWPLIVPGVLLLVYLLAVMNGVFSTLGPDAAPFAEKKRLLFVHSLGYVAIASLAFLWIWRLSLFLAVPAVLVFLVLSLDDVAVQYWTLNELAQYYRGHGGEARIEGDFELVAPGWVEWLAGDGYKTYRLKVDVEPEEFINDPRVVVRLGSDFFNGSATAITQISLAVSNSREASVTVPQFIKVSGPTGVRGKHPTRERTAVGARLFGRTGEAVSWVLREDQVNHLSCTVHDLALGDCEILSDLAEAP